MNTSDRNERIKSLIDIAVTLADHTQSAERCAGIPDYISSIFELECVTLGVVRQSRDDAEPQVLISGSSGRLAITETESTLHRNLLAIHHQTIASASWELRQLTVPMAPLFHPCVELELAHFTAYPHTLVFAYCIDADHHMLFNVHLCSSGAPLPAPIVENLVIITQELSKQLHFLISWHSSPKALGKPFDALTDREWLVLRALNSDVSEKQLADRLGLRPNTLHTHIKSVYRKVGVQCRLALVFRVNAALRHMRMNTFNYQDQSIMLMHTKPPADIG